LWSAGKNSPESTCTPNLKNVASSDTEILRGSQISFPLAPLPLNRLGTKSIGFGGLRFRVSSHSDQAFSFSSTNIQTYKHTSKVKTVSTPIALRKDKSGKQRFGHVNATNPNSYLNTIFIELVTQ